MHKRAAYWLQKLTQLNTANRDGISPHKPFLLLVVADLVEDGILCEPVLHKTADLNFRFLAIAGIAAERLTQKPDLKLPFFHISRDGLWMPLDDSGQVTRSRDAATTVVIEEEFFACLCDEEFRRELRRVLIARYFVDPSERAALYELYRLPVPAEDEVFLDAKRYEMAKRTGRNARFKVVVNSAYNYTCALFRINVTTIDSEFIVEACHIHEHSKSGNDDPRNGIALCRNAHWMFDRGLWTIDDNFRVQVATKRFDESGNASFFLKPLEGQKILLPSNKNLWPDKANLRWHRTTVFNQSRRK